ncbi:hypothetical protein GCM10009682_60880 [Luedemannella flava]|uniref:Uncharacterized protein n=1 Tax=Luedemannella flava TaxID=349316 RepID=A0ABN2MQL0_9ACTN
MASAASAGAAVAVAGTTRVATAVRVMAARLRRIEGCLNAMLLCGGLRRGLSAARHDRHRVDYCEYRENPCEYAGRRRPRCLIQVAIMAGVRGVKISDLCVQGCGWAALWNTRRDLQTGADRLNGRRWSLDLGGAGFLPVAWSARRGVAPNVAVDILA